MARSPNNARNRRARDERRDPDREADYRGAERRQGPRRKADLRRPLWRQPIAVLIAATLGVLAALHLDRLPGFAPVSLHSSSHAPQRWTPSEPVEPAPRELTIDPEQLAAAQTMRDEAERLTLAEVTLDEQTHERWLPRIARIEAVRSSADIPELLRVELDATVEALARVGLL